MKKKKYLHRLSSEWLITVTREHANKSIQHDLRLVFVCGSALYEDIAGLQGDLAMVAVDDGGEGEHHALLICNHWVHRFVL